MTQTHASTAEEFPVDVGDAGRVAAVLVPGGDDIPAASTGRRKWMLGILGVALTAELSLWLTHAAFYVTPHYPGGHDQAVYLARAYANYQRLQQLGLGSGLLNILRQSEPQGVLLSAVAPFWFLFTGPTRLGALSLNFLAFAGLQTLVALALRRATGQVVFPVAGVALLVSVHTAYLTYGGLFDFRNDFVAFCGYGSVCALGVLSNAFRYPWSSVGAGMVAALTIVGRFITAPYFLLAFLVLAAFVYADLRQASTDTKRRRIAQLRIRNLLIALAVTAAIAGPVLAFNAPAIMHYYFGRFSAAAVETLITTGPQQGVFDSVLFYPRALAAQHASVLSVLGGLILFAVGILAAVRGPRWHRPVAEGRRDWAPSLLIGASIAAPVLVLSLYHTKDPLLAGVVVAPLIMGCVLAAAWLASHGGTASLTATDLAMRVASVALSVVAAYAVLDSMTRPVFPGVSEPDLRALDELQTDLARETVGGLELDHVLANSLADYLAPATIQATAFERFGSFPDPGGDLGSLPLDNALKLADSREQALALASSADGLLLTNKVRPNAGVDFSFYPSLEAVTPELTRLAEDNLVRIRTYELGDRSVALYLRPRAILAGVTADGWITSAGVVVYIPPWALPRVASIELVGLSDFAALRDVPQVHARASASGQQTDLPAYLSVNGSDYQLEVDTTWLRDKAGQAQIDLTFSSNFVPAQQGINSDTRELVLRAPQVVRALPTNGAQQEQLAGTASPP